MIDFCTVTVTGGNTGAELGFLVATGDGRIPGYHCQVAALRQQNSVGIMTVISLKLKLAATRWGIA